MKAPVTLSQIKNHKQLFDTVFVRQASLSVTSVLLTLWNITLDTGALQPLVQLFSKFG
jgi:predicted RNA-binding protein with PUA-like domain